MAYIIDGHNLIGVLPDIRLADPDDETRLLHRLRAFRARAGPGRLIVFFDAGPGSREMSLPVPGGGHHLEATKASPGVEVRFSEPGQTADDAIVAFLRGETQPGQYAVVTDDQGLTWRIRALGASAIRASDFAGRLAPRTKRASRKAERGDATFEPAPDPHEPAFADIYAGFMSAEKARARLPDETSADAGAWLEKLYADDAAEAQLAARWLGQHAPEVWGHGGKEALEPLLDALTHSDARVRAAALLAFGDLGDRQVLPALCERLTNDGASIVRQAAAQSLGRIGDRSVESTLETAAETDPKSRVRKAARDALAQIHARSPRPPRLRRSPAPAAPSGPGGRGLRKVGQDDAKPPS
jgi:uncharacterized protein